MTALDVDNININGNTIKSTDSDGDIVFGGNDGGSAITALTLDMSDAGSASFNHDVKLSDSSELVLGNSSDIRMFHDGTNSFILCTVTGALSLKANDINIMDAQSHNMITAAQDGSVGLYYDNALKVLTSSTGINLPVDGDKIQFGANSEVQLVHEHDVGLSLNGGGALILADNNTDDTNKTAYLVARQYDSGSETEGFLTIQTFGNSSGNRIDIGGGTSQRNASTEINFYTAANTTTRTGTNRMVVNGNGINVTGAVDGDNFKINGDQGSDGQLMTSTGSVGRRTSKWTVKRISTSFCDNLLNINRIKRKRNGNPKYSKCSNNQTSLCKYCSNNKWNSYCRCTC